MPSILEVVISNVEASRRLPKVRDRLIAHVQQHKRCTVQDVEAIIKRDPEIAKDLPKDARMLRLISSGILLKFRKEQLDEQADPETAASGIKPIIDEFDTSGANTEVERLMEQAQEKMDEAERIMAVPFVKALKVFLEEGRSFVDAGLTGNFQMIKRELASRFGIADIPHEEHLINLLKIFGGNQYKDVREKLFNTLDQLQEREVDTPDAAEAWLSELMTSLEDTAKELSTSGELKAQLKVLFEAVKKDEFVSFKNLFSLILQGFTGEIGLSAGIKIDFDRVMKLFKVDNLTELRKFIGAKNYDSLANSIADLIKNPAIRDTLQAVGVTLPPGSVEHVQQQVRGQTVGWGNGYGKWFIGIGAGLLGAIGLFVQNGFGKSLLFGIGALGLGGVIASASKKVRELFGFVS